MKYESPKYALDIIEASDVITASSFQANNCTVTPNAEGTFTDENGEPTTVTQVSGFFNSLIR